MSGIHLVDYEVPCRAVKISTFEVCAKTDEFVNICKNTICSGLRVTHRTHFVLFRSADMRDIALTEFQKVFASARADKKISWVRNRYLNPQGR